MKPKIAKVVRVTKTSELKRLEKESTMTWVGIPVENENLELIVDNLSKYLKEKVVFYTWPGLLMNTTYGLKKSFFSDETFLAIGWECFNTEFLNEIAQAKAKVGARWLDDIIANRMSR